MSADFSGARIVTYRCACGRSNSVAASESSPLEARHRCPSCARPNLIKTRPSSWRDIDELGEMGTDEERTARRASTNFTKSDQLDRELVAIREARLRSLDSVPTPWGRGYLIQ